MKIVKIKKTKKHCFEKFLNKIFKNGKKYKFFKFLKNSLILFKILKKIFKNS
jgi:ribosomal protein S7